MSETDQQIEWYLARDGKQHGPISDLEMRKVVELGHLRPTDLVWRQGFPDWVPANTVFPIAASQPAPPPPTMPRPAAEIRNRPATSPQGGREARAHGPGAQSPLQQHGAYQQHAPQQPQARTGDPRRAMPADGGRPRPHPVGGAVNPSAIEPDDIDMPQRGSFPWKTVAAVLLLAVMSGAGLALHKTGRLNFHGLAFLTGDDKDALPVVRAPKESLKESPLKGFDGNADNVDTAFQKAPLWRFIKKEFPDWYGERVNDAVRLKGEQKDDKEIAVFMTQALVDLRRKNSDAALSASPARLKFIASAFVENLDRLSKQSIDACYGFISQGESSPAVVNLLRSSEHVAALQAQFLAIFEAVVEGRKSPATHAAPQREDYDVLAAQLALRGWSPADLQLFSDARALSRAQPERVCKMVHDWFSAQLAVKDEAVQMRLLVEALKPVVAG